MEQHQNKTITCSMHNANQSRLRLLCTPGPQPRRSPASSDPHPWF